MLDSLNSSKQTGQSDVSNGRLYKKQTIGKLVFNLSFHIQQLMYMYRLVGTGSSSAGNASG